jgi:hypothetical protein
MGGEQRTENKRQEPAHGKAAFQELRGVRRDGVS